jgi:UDP-2,4-diacetamido-2,4,6-trideoxy-beta-L-altropyranose hydrolase
VPNSNQKNGVAFRVDASVDIGTGHAMRCLTLANILRDQEVKSYFICRDHPHHIVEKLETEGHHVILLPLAHEKTEASLTDERGSYLSWLGASPEVDADETIRALQTLCTKWLVVDHFAIDELWEKHVKQETNLKIMVIDGRATHNHDCDLLLDQTYDVRGESRWRNLVPAGCQLFLGPVYALLRPEFEQARKSSGYRDGNIRNILIAFGGADDPNATSIALEALSRLRSKFSIDVVLGPLNPHSRGLIEKYGCTERINIWIAPENISELMGQADLAIGGGGMMTWERCLLRLPTIVLSIAENQVDLAKSLHSISVVTYLGDAREVEPVNIRNAVLKLMNNQSRVMAMGSACEKLMPRNNAGAEVANYLVREG